MLTQKIQESIARKTVRMLRQIGIKVASTELSLLMKNRGCGEASDGRILIPEELIREFVIYQNRTRREDDMDQELHPYYGVDWAHHIIWNRQRDGMLISANDIFSMPAFDCGPTKYFDYPTGKVLAVDTAIFEEMMKLAECTPEIGYTSTWYRQDIDPRIERIDSLVKGIRLTAKLDGIEAIYPEVLKYLKGASEIITGKAGDYSFIAGSECITPPLILDRRSADDIIERARCGIHRYHVASMIAMGINTPITVASAAILGAAEILGGMIACWCVDPDSDITGRIIAGIVDMRNAGQAYAAPEVTQVNIAVKEVFDAFWGGHLWTEVFFSPSSKVPGLQTVFEYYSGASRYAYLTGRPVPYGGMGTLDNGAVGSPTQLMLDMEIRKADFMARRKVGGSEREMMFEELCESVKSPKDFLTSDYTLDHYREIWSSNIFRSDLRNEKAILDRCDQMWRDNLTSYVPPEWPEEKLKDLDGLVAEAKKDLCR